MTLSLQRLFDIKWHHHIKVVVTPTKAIRISLTPMLRNFHLRPLSALSTKPFQSPYTTFSQTTNSFPSIKAFSTTQSNNMRVLLTGGSGFIAAHVLEYLLEHKHSVVTTVRSQAKADKVAAAHPKAGKDQLDFAIVEDVAQEGAFDKAVVSNPPFDAVIHTASPFHFNVTDVQKELLDPAYIGTTGILKSIKKSAPSVKRVVITSSFASIVNPNTGNAPNKTYSEEDWNPITQEEVLHPDSSLSTLGLLIYSF